MSGIEFPTTRYRASRFTVTMSAMPTHPDDPADPVRPEDDRPDPDTPTPAWPEPTRRPPMTFTEAAFPDWPDTDNGQELFV